MRQYDPIKILKSEIKIGLPQPVKFLHVTDSHMALDDPGNDCGRARLFEKDKPGCCADYFEQAAGYAKENNMMMLHTGDLIDFLSEANFAYADKAFDGIESMYAAGNHDFCHCVGAAKEGEAYKWENMKRVAPHFAQNLYFDSKVVQGVNVVTLDDSYYRISDGQIAMLRAEVAKGYPIILCMHVPVFTYPLADLILGNGNPCCYLTCPPEEYLARFPENRRLQQEPDEATKRAVEYIKNESQIRAIITGHVHLNYEEQLENGAVQITTHAGYAGYAREIIIT